MSNWKDRQVIIVGGGIGGLAAALALARKGIPSQLIEQAPEFKEIGAGIQLGPNVFWMFEALGLIEPISALAVFPNNLIMMDSVTGAGGHAHSARRCVPQEIPSSLCAHSSRRPAQGAAAGLPEIRPHPPRCLAESRQGRRDRRRRHRAAPRAARTYRGAALIGADGCGRPSARWWSATASRNLAGHITYRAVLPTSEMPEQYRWRDMVLWAGEKVHLVHYPLRTGELFNLVAVFHSNRYEEGWDSYGDPAELHERFAKTCEPVRTLLNKIESWRMWVLCDRPPIKDWSRGRITLLGDAAHPMLQYLAQGAGMSIEDAVCLADKVVAVERRLSGGVPRLPAGALSAHRPRADHGARLWRVLSRRRRRQGAAQHDARLAHAGRCHGRDGVALRQAA